MLRVAADNNIIILYRITSLIRTYIPTYGCTYSYMVGTSTAQAHIMYSIITHIYEYTVIFKISNPSTRSTYARAARPARRARHVYKVYQILC